MNKIITEGLDYNDMNNQIDPTLSVDDYSAKMGTDDEIVTLAFTVKSRLAAKDLVDWFERGYAWILDAKESDGEVTSGKYLVFVELNRRTQVPERICELIEDLETLTEMKSSEWTIMINDEEYNADPEVLKTKIILSPQKYRETFPDEDEEINEMRNRAGLEHINKYKEKDTILRDYLAKAGL